MCFRSTELTRWGRSMLDLLINVIRLYGLCFKIELSFDQALRVLSFPEG